jgi:uncharacterized protein
MSALVIDTRRLRDRPEPLRLATDASWWERTRPTLREPGVRLLHPFALELVGHALGRRLLFRGALRGQVELVCSRCADPYPVTFDERIELLLEPSPDPEPIAEGGIRLDPEDNTFGHYTGEELDFEPVLNETLWLAWPMQPCCRPDCRGLCPRCGANRNREACGCDAEPGERPFAGLATRLAERSASERAGGRRTRGRG